MAEAERRFTPYTDLAMEATAALRGQSGGEIPGVRVHEERHPGMTVTRVEVFSPEGERAIGKKQGHYVTIEAPALRERDPDLHAAVRQELERELARLLPLAPDATVLVVGLGNARATPDALGPRVVQRLLVTRHLKQYMPAQSQVRPVAALAPGVLGSTGIETGEIVRGAVQHVRPEAVIVIDALAARSVTRIGTTVQLADTGIHPGSGLGSRRPGLNRETLGVPVIAVGVPTVVHAATIAYDTLELLGARLRGRSPFSDLFATFTADQIRQMINEVLNPAVGDLVVTPKEVDELVDAMAGMIAGALNGFLHTSADSRELLKYM